MFNMRFNVEIIRVVVVWENGGTRAGTSDIGLPPDLKFSYHSVQQQGRKLIYNKGQGIQQICIWTKYHTGKPK